MKIIKRTKGGATHYVEKLSPAGVINGLTKDRAAALKVTDEQLEAFGAFHKGMKPELVGKFSVEDAEPKAPAAPKQPEKPVPPPAPPVPPKAPEKPADPKSDAPPAAPLG